MKVGIADGGVIVNVVEVDPGNIPDFLYGYIPDVEIGWIFNGTNWVAPQEEVSNG